MQKIFDFAKQAALDAGSLALQQWQQPHSLQVVEKAPKDLVTEVDQMVDHYLTTLIQQQFPEHAILTEEQGYTAGNEFTWVIDPIDGTTNLARHVPHFAVSIALKLHEQPIIGVIYDPIRKELFSALKGQGASLNDQAINISNQTGLNNALIATGFPTKRLNLFPAYQDCLQAIFPGTLGMRRGGAATLDLAYVACGRFDGYFEFDVREWDTAAGQVLILEAGGQVCDLAGTPQFPQHGVIAGTPGIVDDITTRLQPIWQQQLEALFNLD